MSGSIAAEFLVLRKRAATWILLGLWLAMTVFFGYILPYISYRNDTGPAGRNALDDLVPRQFVGNVLGGFPFFGGILILILGVLVLGSEYGWGTLKVLFTQRPGRLQIFAAKLVAVGVVLLVFVVGSFAVAALASWLIAIREDAAVDWPVVGQLLRGVGAAWLIFAVWAALGVFLAEISRGTALAIGLGMLYGMVIEGLASVLFDQVDALGPLSKVLLRTNGYSLVAAAGTSTEAAQENGPGAFSGPYVGGLQAMLVLIALIVVFVAIAGYLLRRRDVA